MLNLREHLVGRENAKMLYSAGDIEGHFSAIDSRYYVIGILIFDGIIDHFLLTSYYKTLPELFLHNTTPRTSEFLFNFPDSGSFVISRIYRRSPYLYQLLRPELVRSFPKPLSPDAFLFWGSLDQRKEEFEDDIREATAHLYDKVMREN